MCVYLKMMMMMTPVRESVTQREKKMKEQSQRGAKKNSYIFLKKSHPPIMESKREKAICN